MGRIYAFISFVTLLVFLAIFSGCGTILSRTAPKDAAVRFDPPYTGVQYDVERLDRTRKGLFIFPFLDVPLSTMADTVLLPTDIVIWWVRGDSIKK